MPRSRRTSGRIVATISDCTATSASSTSSPAVSRPRRPRNTSRHGAAPRRRGGGRRRRPSPSECRCPSHPSLDPTGPGSGVTGRLPRRVGSRRSDGFERRYGRRASPRPCSACPACTWKQVSVATSCRSSSRRPIAPARARSCWSRLRPGMGFGSDAYLAASPKVRFADYDECWRGHRHGDPLPRRGPRLAMMRPGAVLITMLHYPTRPAPHRWSPTSGCARSRSTASSTTSGGARSSTSRPWGGTVCGSRSSRSSGCTRTSLTRAAGPCG